MFQTLNIHNIVEFVTFAVVIYFSSAGFMRLVVNINMQLFCVGNLGVSSVCVFRPLTSMQTPKNAQF